MRARVPRSLSGFTARTTLAGLVLVVAGIALFALLLTGVHSQRTAARDTDRAQEILLAIERVKTLTLETQAGTRGYLITREPGFLVPWRDARDRARAAAHDLMRQVGRESLPLNSAGAIVMRVESLIVDWQQPLIELAQGDPAAAFARFRTGEAYRRTIEIKRLIGAFAGQVEALKSNREQRAEDATRRATVSAIAGMTVFLALVLVVATYGVLRVGRPIARLTDTVTAMEDGPSEVASTGARGEVGALVQAFGDMTERLRDARSALEREARQARSARDELAAVVDGSPIAIIVRDRAGVITGFNAAAERISGWPAEQVIGTASAHLHDDERDRLAALHERALAGETLTNVELHVRAVHGARVLAGAFAPLRGADGAISGTVSLAEDVTDREQALHDLAVVQARWSAAVRGLPGAALVIFDEQLRYLEAEGEAFRMFGVDPAEIVGARAGGTLHGSDRERTERMCRSALAGELAEDEFELAGHTMRARAVPIDLGDGRRGGMVLSVDITELRRTEAELRRAAERLECSNRELEDFAYVASHDLQEPLRKIQAFGERLSSLYAPQLDERGADYIERMRAAAARMSRLISGLLTYSRVNTDPRPFGPVEVDAVIADVIGDLEPAIHDSDAQIVTERMPAIHGDAVQLRQLFQNLLSNALKFRRGDVAPRVEISVVERERSSVAIQVADNGIGFEQAYAERMFRMFERLHGRSSYEGSGIGLAVCQRIVARHDGSIAATGSPGRGARFVITLPLHRTTADEPRETRAAA